MDRLQRLNQLDPLSKERIQSQIAELLTMGSKLRALSSPLLPSKPTSIRNSFILSPSSSSSNNLKSNNIQSSTSSISPSLLNPNEIDLSNLTSLRLLCARLTFISHLKYNLWKIIYNIEKNKIESSEETEEILKKDDEDINEDDLNLSKNKSNKDFSKQLNALPYVPMSSDIAMWNTEPRKNTEELEAQSILPIQSSSTTSTNTSTTNLNNSNYSIYGLGLFLVKYQRLYSLFMEVRLQFQENQDQNAIMRCASFLESLNEFAKEYKISLDSNLLIPTLNKSISISKINKELNNERVDISVTSFQSLPNWICPRYLFIIYLFIIY